MPTDKVGRLNCAMPAFSVQKPYGQAGRGKSKFTFFIFHEYQTHIRKTKSCSHEYSCPEIDISVCSVRSGFIFLEEL
ncbi:hypothetical protein T08_4895 [Trichinella sp. T8]|nr:hypothetical protein T08_4895 [Trichinella sp. T8]